MPKNKRYLGVASNKIKKEEAARKALIKQQRKENEEYRRLQALKETVAAENALKIGRWFNKAPQAALDAIASGTLNPNNISRTSPLYMMGTVYKTAVDTKKHYIGVLRQLLLHCHKHTDLFEGPDATKYANGLVAISSYKSFWLKPLEEWEPTSHNNWRQFDSLIRYLFAKYPIPTFMNTAWYEGLTPNGVKYQKWFIHLGSGKNIRTAADLPMSMTKKMAHYFLSAPNDFDVASAFRWAQVIDMGGDERLVRSILSTRLSAGVGLTDEFWVSCVRWLIANPMLDPVHHGPILDYVYNQKYVRSIPNESMEGPRLLAPQPNFTMKGRNPETLLRLVDEWHRRLGRETKRGGPDAVWGASILPHFEHEEGDGQNKKVYTITELLSSQELRNEGNVMNHCVGSYTHSCVQGSCSIWSMKRYDMVTNERLVTIQVNNNENTITQVRGKRNAMPNAKEVNILHRWGTMGGPGMSKWITR